MRPRAAVFPPAEKLFRGSPLTGSRPTTSVLAFRSAYQFFPPRRTLPALARAVDDCRACPLYRHATQAVFGEGNRDARLVMVGETPGDQEDLQGHVFVGPAGHLLDRCLAEVGLPREELWLTNAVKHFKFEERGKRRIHKKPSTTEVQACFPWLEAELERLGPEMIVCLGAVATRAVLGPKVGVVRDHGKVFTSEWAPWVMPTYHPSALLRAPDDRRDATRETFLADLRIAARRYFQGPSRRDEVAAVAGTKRDTRDTRGIRARSQPGGNHGTRHGARGAR